LHQAPERGAVGGDGATGAHDDHVAGHDRLGRDGRLDPVVASPEKPADWGAITTRILARANDAPGVERAQAKVVTFDVDEPVPYQIDGDPMGECSRLEASSLARVLEVMTPGRRP